MCAFYDQFLYTERYIIQYLFIFLLSLVIKSLQRS